MKTKLIISVSLIVFFFLAGTIIIFGTKSNILFPIIYFSFIFLLIGAIIYSSKEILRYKKLRTVVFLSGIIIALTLVFFMSNLKIYLEETKQVTNYTDLVNKEIKEISASNLYYEQYINYLKSQVPKDKILVIQSSNYPKEVVNNEIIEIEVEDTETFKTSEEDEEEDEREEEDEEEDEEDD